MVVSRLCDCLRVLRERGRERRSAELESPRESREVQRGMGCADVCWPCMCGAMCMWPCPPCRRGDCESGALSRPTGHMGNAFRACLHHTPNLHISDTRGTFSDTTHKRNTRQGRRLPQQRPSAPRPVSQQACPLLPPADGARLRLAGQLARPLARLCRSLPERLAAPVIPGGLEDHPQDDDEEHHHVGRRRRRRRRPRRGRRGRRRPRRAGRRRRRRWRRR